MLVPFSFDQSCLQIACPILSRRANCFTNWLLATKDNYENFDSNHSDFDFYFFSNDLRLPTEIYIVGVYGK